MDFSKIAPYLQDPLVLIGFVLLLFFGVGRAVIKSGIIPTLSQRGGAQVLSRFLLYGFLLALAIIALGFGLKYRELSKVEQANAVRLLHQELTSNLSTISELQKNIETISGSTQVYNKVLRHPGIKIMSAVFPNENLDPNVEVPASVDYARALLTSASEQGLLADELELRKFNEAAVAIAGTIKRTRGAVASLSDESRERYRIETKVWDAHLPIIRKVEIVSITDIQSLYDEMNATRASYSVAVKHAGGYHEALLDFLEPEPRTVTIASLASVLAAERLFVTTANEFFEDTEERISQIAKVMQEQVVPAAG